MAKKISSVIYEINVDNPNKIANYDPGRLLKDVGEDLKSYCGRPVQGMVVATSAADKIVAKAKSDLIAGKLKHPILRAGVCGAELIFQVVDKDNSKYEQVAVLNKNYVKLRDEIKNEKAKIANLQPRDDVARDAADKLGRAKGVTPKHGSNLPWGKITGSTPLVLIAHGSEEQTDKGTVYGKQLAGKTPAQLVTLLTENPKDDRRLSPEYSGTIYLNGCYTATPDKMGTFAETFWKLLKAKGYTKLKVKGNIGAASATDKGSMLVMTPEAEKAAEKLKAKFEKELGVKFDKFQEKFNEKEKSLKDSQSKLKKLMDARTKIWNTTFKKTNDAAGFKEAPLVQKIDKEITDTLQPAIKQLTTDIADWEQAAKKLVIDIKKIPGYDVEDLVGQYGLDVYR